MLGKTKEPAQEFNVKFTMKCNGKETLSNFYVLFNYINKKSSYKNLIRFQSSKFPLEQKEKYYGNSHIKLLVLYENSGTTI
jgi:hypothetical protein